jgi:ABC-type transport system involved in multi-copper enzyme maturation permease subunit
MSLVKSSWSWLRQTVGWSNSRQSWEERIGLLLLACAVGGVWWFGRSLSAVQQLILVGVLLLAGAILLRRGWLKLFGPVLFYDMIRIARRGRYFGLRCLYAGLLLFFLLIAYLETSQSTHGTMTAQQAGRFAESYFNMFMLVQMIAVLLLTPAYVAGSVADEKVRKTLEFLLATDLRNREIVLSKLGARLANLTLFVMTGLPILSLIQFLGGVDPNLVLAGFAATGVTVIGLAGLSIAYSVSFRRPRDAITMTYLTVIAYIVLSILAYGGQRSGWSIMSEPVWFGKNAPTVSDLVDGFNSGNFFLGLEEIRAAGVTGTLSVVIPKLLARYALFHGIIAAACTALAVSRLRRVALQQASRSKRARSGELLRRPAVGTQPMLWKELFVEGGVRFNLLTALILAILMISSLLPGFWILTLWLLEPHHGQGMPWWNMAREMNIYVRFASTAVACLLLLAVAVRAASSISSERDRQTFDALLTTPLESDSVLWSKWLGNMLSIRLGWIWLGIILLLGVLSGGLHIFALGLVLGAWTIYAGVISMIGMWFSMVSRSTMRATVWTILVTLTLGGAYLFLCMPLLLLSGMHRGGEQIAKFLFGLTPPAVLGILSYTGQDFREEFGAREIVELVFFCLFGLFIWAVAGLAFWFGVLSPRFRLVMGRQGFRTPEGRPPRSRSRPIRTQAAQALLFEPKDVILLENIREKPKDG